MSNQNPAQQKDRRTVNEKIADLERAVISMFNMNSNMAQDLGTAKEALSLMGLKTDAIILIAERAGLGITTEAVAAAMVEIKQNKMKEDVALYVTQGVIAPADTITMRSFVVGRDLSKDGSGTVINPRLQFTMNPKEISPESIDKLLGAKVGQVIVFGDDKNQFEVQEIYLIGKSEEPAPEAPAEAPAAEAAPAEAPSESAAQ